MYQQTQSTMTTQIKEVAFNIVSNINGDVYSNSLEANNNRDLARTEMAGFVTVDSLAWKIITSRQARLTDKQLWVIAFEALKNAEFVAMCEKVIADRNEKAADQKAKLAANKAASSDVLASVKVAGRKLADYYAFLKGSKQFAREFYSKKYSADSVNSFLAI